MSAKCLDQQGRWRNKVVAFRMSLEEDELLETAVRLSGLTKQEYIIRRLQEKEVVVTHCFQHFLYQPYRLHYQYLFFYLLLNQLEE